MEMVGQLINGLLVLAILGCGVMLFVVTDSAIRQINRNERKREGESEKEG